MDQIDQVREMLAGLIGGPDTPFMQRRAQSEAFAAAFVAPPGLHIEQGELGGVPVEWIVPDGADRAPVLFHLHGGGYVLGKPNGSRPFTTAFALKARARVVSVDYRLAPENPFPAGVDDGVAAYAALLEKIPASRVAIGGESAGGGLAVAIMLAAREKNLPLPSSVLLISPWTDLSCTSETFNTKAYVDPLLTRRSLKEMADAYVPEETARSPLASPLFGDLAGLPPMLIHVGSEEVLLDDAKRLHKHASEQGVKSQIEIWHRMIHVWHMFHPMLAEGDVAIRKLAEFARAHWPKEA
ncbi:MAG TPA: alpha/beta hydrolase [Rhizomicrobium sp.]|nr:alpha/beta hydrolase [Rhizomicrobium sp.]